MKGQFRKINSDKIIRMSTYISFGLLSLQLIYILVYYFYLPPYLPLYNQMPWGEERIGHKIEIFLPIIITVSFFALNIFISLQLYEKMPLVSRVLCITSLLISILTFIFVVQTVQLVI
jgi:hypothetical protein